MPRIAPADGPLAPAARAELDRQLAVHGRVTNLKRTLAHSPAGIAALMEWYPLRDEVASFLGDRDTTIFAHAVSTETACIVCSTFFRRILVDSGEDPDRLELNARTQALVAFGRELGRDQGRVPAAAYAAVAELLSPPQVVALVAFGAMMVATNIVVNALDIDLDDYLEPYRRPGGVK